MSTIIVRVLRPLRFGGECFQPGQTLKVTALEAAHLLDSGRAGLVHADDAREVQAARRADLRNALASAGRPWAGPQVSPPWQRVI